MTMSMIIGYDNITTQIDGEDVLVKPVELSAEIELMQYNDPAYEFIQYVEGSGKFNGQMYAPIEGNKTKVDYSMETQFGSSLYDLTFYYSASMLSIEEKLFDDEPSVIEIGSNWTEISKTEGIETKTMIIDGVNQEKVENTLIDKMETTKYECIGEETVNVTAGTFDTYIIKEIVEGETNYTIGYYDKITKIPVKLVEYDENDISTNSEMELISIDLSYSPESGEDNGDGMPGFECIMLFIAISAVFILHKKRKK